MALQHQPRTVSVREATLEDLPELLEDIREYDRLEWVGGLGMPLEPALRAAIELGGKIALDQDGKPLCMWGSAPTLSDDIASVWLVATNRATDFKFSIHGYLKQELEAFYTDGVEWLQADAYSLNTVHLSWLQWLGFKPCHEGPLGPLGLPFTTFLRKQT